VHNVYSFAQKFNEGTELSNQAGRHLIYASIIIDVLKMKISIKDSVCYKLERAMERNEFKPQIEEVTFYVKVLPLPTESEYIDYGTGIDQSKGSLFVYFAVHPDEWTEQSRVLFDHYTKSNSKADHVTFFDYELDDESDSDSLPELESPSIEEHDDNEEIPTFAGLTTNDIVENVNL